MAEVDVIEKVPSRTVDPVLGGRGHDILVSDGQGKRDERGLLLSSLDTMTWTS